MKFLLLIPCMLFSFDAQIQAQPDSLVDVFPLSVGNQWAYRYLTWLVSWPAGNPGETRRDSGQSVYDVLGRVSNTDSTRWQFRLRRDLIRYHSFDWQGRDTTYPIRDTTFFELIENHQGQHQLYRNDDAGSIHLDVFPFTKRFTDTTLIYRYRKVGPGDTVTFKSAFYNGFPTSTRSRFTFRKSEGLMRYRYHSGYFDVFDTAYHYLVNSVITSTDKDPTGNRPTQYSLAQNYPNPFNPKTIIGFTVNGRERVRLEAFDMLGRKVATLVDGIRDAGSTSVEFDGAALASGVYIYRLSTPSATISKRMLLLK